MNRLQEIITGLLCLVIYVALWERTLRSRRNDRCLYHANPCKAFKSLFLNNFHFFFSSLQSNGQYPRLVQKVQCFFASLTSFFPTFCKSNGRKARTDAVRAGVYSVYNEQKVAKFEPQFFVFNPGILLRLIWGPKFVAIAILLLVLPNLVSGQTQTYNAVGTYTFTVPAGVTSITVQAWGAGGGGGTGNVTNGDRTGGGGGAFASSVLSVTPGSNITVIVGNGGTTGNNGGNTTFGATLVVAAGGTSGSNTNPGGLGGLVAASTGTIRFAGGNGGNRANNNPGGGGGGGGSATPSANGGNGGNGTGAGIGGVGGSGQGNGGGGGNDGAVGLNGNGPGGGGGGKGESGATSGNGAVGQVIITWTLATPTITTFSPSSGCQGATGIVITGTNFTGATAVNFNGVSASFTVNSSTQITATVPLTATSGTISVITPSGTGTSATSFTVNPANTSGVASSTPTLCINTILTNITHATTGATGIGSGSGLPSGVTAAWASNTITISGTPTASGTFAYSIPLTGGCGTVNATGTITVTPANTVGAASSTPTLCINTILTNITNATAGATGIGAVSGLPAGVTAAWATNTITISGTPTASGTFTYSIPLTGGCGTVNATGTITVTPDNTVGAASSTPSLCINTILTNITHPTTGTTGIGAASGLPSGVTAAWATNTITISGTPTVSGTFVYSIPLTGGCGTVNATGTITVTPDNTVGAASSMPTLCINTILTNITHATAGATGIGAVSGLPSGVTAAWATNTITISGTPTASGTFTYSIPLTGGCGTVNATGTITVTPDNTINLSSAAGTISQTLCINTAISNITYSSTGATGAISSGLPAGVSGIWSGNVVTISGTPTASGTFNYMVTLTGGCENITSNGTITVTPDNTFTLSSAAGTNNQVICITSAITDITYTTTGATGATFSGLPAGVSGIWAGNLITISGTPTPSGIFNYTVTLIGGCGNITATGTITVNLPPTATAGGTQGICGDGTAYVSGATATNGTILWTHNGNGSISGANTLTPSYTTGAGDAGTIVTLTMTVTNNPCTLATGTYTINVDASLLDIPVNIGPAMPDICMGGVIASAPLGATVGGSPTSIVWTSSAGGTFSSISDPNATWTPSALFTGIATLTLAATTSCGTNIKSKNIVVELIHIVDVGSAMSSICQGGTSGVLGGSIGGGANGGIWSDGGVGGTFNPSATALNASWTPPPTFFGTATLRLTTTGGVCTPASDTKTIVVDEMPVITAQPVDQLDCAGQAGNFKVIATGSGIVYTWQRKKPTDGSFIDIPSGASNVSYLTPNEISIQNAGDSDAPDGTQYRVVLSNGNCNITSSAATLTVNEITDVIPSVSNPLKTDVILCNGSNFNYQVSTLYPLNVVSYQWKKSVSPGVWTDVADGGPIGGSNSSQLTFAGATPAESGEYKVTVVFHSSGADCDVSSDTQSRKLTVLPAIVAPLISGSQTICYNTAPTLLSAPSATGGSGTSYSYQWESSPDNSNWTVIGGATSITYQPPALINSIYYRIIATDTGTYSCGTATSAGILITVNPAAQVNSITSQSICNGSGTAAITFSTNNSIGVTTYSWTNDQASIGLSASGTGDIASFTAINNGNTVVVATISVIPHLTNGGTTCNGPAQSFSITVNPTPTLTGASSAALVCEGTPATINLTGLIPNGVSILNYTINSIVQIPITGLTADASGNASFNTPNLTAANNGQTLQITDITVTSSTPNCTKSFAVNVLLSVRPSPTASISGGATVCKNSVPPSITFTNPMPLPVEVTYNINGGAIQVINISANNNFSIFTPTSFAGTFNYNMESVHYQSIPNCPNFISGTVVVTVLETPLATVTGTNTVCQDDLLLPVLTFSNSHASPITVTYNVNGSNQTTISVLANSTATVSAPTSVAGTFVYNLVTSAYQTNPSCSNNITGTATITVRPKPVATISVDATVCQNSSPFPNVTISNPQTLPIRVTYTINNGTPLTLNVPASSPSVITVNTSIAGDFIYKITSVQYATAPNCPNVLNVSATVSVLPTPTVAISGTTSVCKDDASPLITFTNTKALPITVTYNVNGANQATINVGAISTATVSVPTSVAGSFAYNLESVVYQGGLTCSNLISGVATITVRPAPVVSISGNATVCQYASPSPNIVLTNLQTLQVTVTYNINGGPALTVSVPAGLTTSIPVSTMATGSFTYNVLGVQYSAAPACSNALNISATVIVLPAPTVTLNGTTSVCMNDGSPVITFINPQALPITVVYDINGVIQPSLNIGSSTTTTITAPTTVSGIFNYNVVSAAYQSGAACTNSTTGAYATITVKALPAAPVAGNNGPVCVGNTLSLTAGTVAGATYSWTGPNGFTSSTQNPTISASATTLMAGTYSVTATVNGCTGPAGTTTVTVNSIPASPTAGNNGPVCMGSTLSLTASNIAGATYSWTGPNGFTSAAQNPTVSAGATMVMAGTYSVTANVNGCLVPVATTIVTVTQAPAIPNQTVTICSGSAFAVNPENGNPSGTIVPMGTTYSWAAPTGGGFIGGSAQANQANIGQTLTLSVATVGATATYTVTPRANGCNGTTFTVTVTIVPLPKATNVSWYQFDVYTDEWTQCAGQSGELVQNDLDLWVRNAGNTAWIIATTPNTFTGNDSYFWEYTFEDLNAWAPSPMAYSTNYQLIMPPAPSIFTRIGKHYFRFQVTKNGCTAYSDTITMTMTSDIIVVTGDPLFVDCKATPTPIQLIGSNVSAVNFPNPCAAWTIESLEPTNGGVNGSLSSTNCTATPANVTYTPPANYSGTVTLKLTTNDPDGAQPCSSTYEFKTITISPVAGADAGNPQSVCAGGMVTLNGSLYGTATGGTWTAPSGTFSTANSLTSTYTPSIASGNVTLTLTPNVSGSCIETSTVVITVNPAPQTTGVIVCQGGSGSLTSPTVCPSGGTYNVGPFTAGNSSSVTGTGSVPWSNPTRALTNDNQYATAALSAIGITTSNYLRITNYGFSLPSNATILGIRVIIGRFESNTGNGNDVRDVEVRLLKAGTPVVDNKANTGTDWPTNETAANYGSISDLWGTTWNVSDINASNFGVSLVANSDNNRTASVDYITVTVTYTVNGVINWYTTSSGGTSIGSGTPFNPVGVVNSGLPNTNTPGTYTFYVECTSYIGCRTATNFVINPKPTVTKPADFSTSACTYANQAALDVAFASWLAGFSVSGGASPVGLFQGGTPLAPTLCTGGTVNAVYNYTDACETSSVSATFTITAPTAFTVNSPADVNTFTCDYVNQAAVNTAFSTWLAGFNTTGGCASAGTFSGGTPTAPLICGGSVTAIYNVTDLCSTGSVTKSFTINGTSTVVLTPPLNPVVASSCDFVDQAEVNADFALWLTGFTTTGGCSGTATYGTPTAPLLCVGGSSEVTYVFTDVCTTKAVTSSYTITAPADLIVSGPADVTKTSCEYTNQAAVDAAFATWLTGFSASGGCGGSGSFSTTTAPLICTDNTVDVTYTFTDKCESGSVTASFTLNSNNSLVINQPNNVNDPACFYSSQADLNSVFADWLTGFYFVGGCSPAGSYGTPTAPALCAGGTTTVTYTVTDQCGLPVTGTAIFTIIKPADLIIGKPISITEPACNYPNQDALNTAFEAWLTGFSVTGGCDPVGTYGNQAAPDLCDGGSTTVVYNISDLCMTTSTSAVFTVLEVTHLTVVQLDEHTEPSCQSQAAIDAAFVAWIDEFTTSGGCNVNNVPDLEAAYTAPSACGGSITVNFAFYDACGHTAYGSAVFTVEPDVIKPVITCPSDVSGVAGVGECTGTVNIGTATATDICSTPVITNNAPVQFPVGTTTVTWTATDACGNFSTCDQLVTVIDDPSQPPTFTYCPGNQVQTVLAGNCALSNVVVPDPVATDNCPVTTLIWTMTGATTLNSPLTGINYVTGQTFNVGLTTVTYTAFDAAGNTASCSFTVTIQSVTTPNIAIVGCSDVSESAAANNCSKIPATLIDPTYSDNCWPLASLTLSWTMIGATTGNGLGSVVGQTFNIGVTTVTYTVTNPDGNSSTCSFNVTIHSVTAPNITVGGCVNVSESAAANNCSKIPTTIPPPTYSDNCWPLASLTLTWTMTGATIGSGPGSVVGQTFNVGVTTVTYLVANPDGNTATCSFTVTILSVTAPNITIGCVDVTESAAANNCSKIPATIPPPTYSDNCWPLASLNLTWTMTGATISTGSGSVVGQTFNVGVTTVDYVVTNPDGNSATCSFQVTILSVTPAVFSAGCPLPVVPAVTPLSGSCTASVTVPKPAVSDPCLQGYTVVNSFNGTDDASGTYPVGTTTVTWTITSPGNVTTCNQLITVNDLLPALACPGNQSVSADFNQTYASNVAIPAPVYSDNCPGLTLTWVMTGATTGNSLLTGENIVPSTGTYNLGVTTITYTLTDANAHQVSCSFTITVTAAPEITCLPDINHTADPGECHYTINPGTPTLLEGVQPITWIWTIDGPNSPPSEATGTFVGSLGNPGPPDIGSYDFKVGTSIVTWTATNVSGNDVCTQTVIVTDDEDPTFTARTLNACVDMLHSATYTTGIPNPNVGVDPNLIKNPSPDYYTFAKGSTLLDLTDHNDNCCNDASLIINWRIDFTDVPDPLNPSGPLLSHPSISGTGQPSTYIDPGTGLPADIYLWGDGVNFAIVQHTITYWVEDCHGNISADQPGTITINPRPKITKVY